MKGTKIAMSDVGAPPSHSTPAKTTEPTSSRKASVRPAVRASAGSHTSPVTRVPLPSSTSSPRPRAMSPAIGVRLPPASSKLVPLTEAVNVPRTSPAHGTCWLTRSTAT